MVGNTKKNKINDSIFLENLRYACDKVEKVNKVILIEVLNSIDATGYYLDDFKKALDKVNCVGANNLEIMFNCYHLQK
jgi:hydroxypyruvate isomerase